MQVTGTLTAYFADKGLLKRMLRRNERNGVFCSKCETLFNRKKTGNICPNCEMPVMPRHSRAYRKHIRRMKARGTP